jgi:inner membrane organizing system protein 1
MATSCDHSHYSFAQTTTRIILTTSSQWDRCLSSMLIRSGLGLGFGVVFSVLLFKRRAWPAFVGLGFGAGRSWEECDNVRLNLHPGVCLGVLMCGQSFKRAAAPSHDGLRVIRP